MKVQHEHINSFTMGDLVLNITSEDKQELYQSYKILEQSRKINIIATLILILFGLIGNSLIVFVFSKKRFRVNSSNVFLLCLALNDSLFLIIHLFEDTLRTYEEIYTYDSASLNSTLLLNINKFISAINITDQFNLACRLFSYLRYVLRFVSAYIIVVFTLQRLAIVSSPLKDKFKTKKSAWILVSVILAVSLLVNSWVPFFFELQHFDDTQVYCEIKEDLKYFYYMLTNVYIFIIVIIPIVCVFVSNSLIIFKTKKADINRKRIQMKKFKSIQNLKTDSKQQTTTYLAAVNHGAKCSLPLPLGSMISNSSVCQNLCGNDSFVSFNKAARRDALSTSKFDFRLKPLYLSTSQITMKTKSNSLITKMLIIISFSYALLNLPYFITWCLFYKEIKSEFPDPNSLSVQNYLFASVQISEILYMLNYGLHFYFYCISGSRFINQLKHSSKN